MQKPVIRIFTVYEHDLNRNRAQLMQEELTRRLGRSFNFSVSWWRLKSLWHPKMLRVAADAVAQADIMLFALLSGGELPQTLTKWLEETLLHNTTHRVSLLALLETGGMIVPRLSSAEIYLSRLASEAGVDCLCYSDSIPLARTNWRRKARLSVAEALQRLIMTATNLHKLTPGQARMPRSTNAPSVTKRSCDGTWFCKIPREKSPPWCCAAPGARFPISIPCIRRQMAKGWTGLAASGACIS